MSMEIVIYSSKNASGGVIGMAVIVYLDSWLTMNAELKSDILI